MSNNDQLEREYESEDSDILERKHTEIVSERAFEFPKVIAKFKDHKT